MRDMNDLKNAFGEADDGFKNSVCHTLADLKKIEERKPMRKISLRLIVAVAAVFVVTSTAFAMTNALGIFDFLYYSGNIEALPEAAAIVQTELPQDGGESELAAFSVREAIYDGMNIYIVVEAKPADPKYLLIHSDAAISDPVVSLGPLFKNEQGSIAEYAEKNGKIPLSTDITLSPFILEQSGVQSSNTLLEADGVAVHMISAAYESKEARLPIALDCAAWQTSEDEEVRASSLKISSLNVTLQNSGTQNVATSIGTAEYSDSGVRVDKVRLTASPIAIYTEIEYSVIDEAKFSGLGGSLWFEFVDENGDPIPGGATNGVLDTTDGSGLRYIQKRSLEAAETLPGEVILRGRISGIGSLAERHTFEMK